MVRYYNQYHSEKTIFWISPIVKVRHIKGFQGG